MDVTNVKVNRDTVLSKEEHEEMLVKAEAIPNEFFRLRAKAALSLLKPGKRRSEVVQVKVDDLRTDALYLYVTYLVVKKRKKNLMTRSRIKKFNLQGRLAQNILAYRNYVKTHFPLSIYLFPAAHCVFGQSYIIFPDRHADPKEIWRIIKALNSNAWPHLFRETRGAEVVQEDERKGTVSIFTVYRVKHALDLEKETTAWNYINRYASEVVKEEEDSVEI